MSRIILFRTGERGNGEIGNRGLFYQPFIRLTDHVYNLPHDKEKPNRAIPFLGELSRNPLRLLPGLTHPPQICSVYDDSGSDQVM